MLTPRLLAITPNDFNDWRSFAAADHGSIWNASAWFLLDIGLAGFEGSTLFQVLVTTPAAQARATGNDPNRRVLIVESFVPELIEEALHDYVQAAAATEWETVVARLQAAMYWEHEMSYLAR